MEIADTVSPTFQKRHILILTSLTPEKEPVLASNCEKEYACWRDALRQAIRDVAAWKTACKQEMNIVYPSPKKIPSVETKTLYESVEVTLSCNVHGKWRLLCISPFFFIAGTGFFFLAGTYLIIANRIGDQIKQYLSIYCLPQSSLLSVLAQYKYTII